MSDSDIDNALESAFLLEDKFYIEGHINGSVIGSKEGSTDGLKTVGIRLKNLSLTHTHSHTYIVQYSEYYMVAFCYVSKSLVCFISIFINLKDTGNKIVC